MVTVETRSIIPELSVPDVASPVSPTAASFSPRVLADLLKMKGLEVKSTHATEQSKLDLQHASVENLVELARTGCEADEIQKELFIEIEKELLANPRKLSEASVEDLIQLVTAFDKAGLLSPELAKAVKDEILFKDASKLRFADAKQIARLLEVYSKPERVDQVFLGAFERELFAEAGKKMWRSEHQALDTIAKQFRQAKYGDRNLFRAIHVIWFRKVCQA